MTVDLSLPVELFVFRFGDALCVGGSHGAAGPQNGPAQLAQLLLQKGLRILHHHKPAHIVVLAHGADFTQLQIDVRFVGADVADDLAKLSDPIRIVRLLEARGIDHETLLGKLNEDARRPSAKHGRLRGGD